MTNVEELDDRTAMGETMMLGVAASSGRYHRRRSHGDTAYRFSTGLARSSLTSTGVLEADDCRVRLTKRGVLLANSVCAEFL